MNCGQSRCKHLLRLEEVIEIRSGVVLTGVAITSLVDRGELALIPTIGEVYAAILGKDSTRAGLARWRNTVKGISAIFDSNEEVIGLTDAKSVARLVIGQLFAEPAHDRAELLLVERNQDQNHQR